MRLCSTRLHTWRSAVPMKARSERAVTARCRVSATEAYAMCSTRLSQSKPGEQML